MSSGQKRYAEDMADISDYLDLCVKFGEVRGEASG